MIEFRYPLVLFLYIPSIIIWLYWIINSRKKRLLTKVKNSLREKLLIKIDKNRFIYKERLLFSAMLLLIFSASGPQIGSSLKKVESRGVDILVALDISKSMLAEDIKPTRLEKSKFEINMRKNCTNYRLN